MAWMKIELELPDKPEVHYIAAITGIDPDAVVGKLIRVWQWFDKHTTDGNASGVTFALPDRISGVTGFGEAMNLAGWLVQDGSVLTMPKFDRHNGESAKKRALTAERVAKSKQKSNANSVTTALPDALPREEKRREDINALSSASITSSHSSPAGAICARLRLAGIASVNPSNPKFLALLSAGVTADEFVDLASEPSARGKGFSWILAAVEGRRRDAAKVGDLPQARASPNKPINGRQAAISNYAAQAAAARGQENECTITTERDITGECLRVA